MSVRTCVCVQVKEEKKIVKQEPNFGVSGKLAAETNTLRGVVLKYNEPPEAAVCPVRWRLYEFKDDNCNIIYIHRQSAFLIGREQKVRALIGLAWLVRRSDGPV